MSDGLSRAVRPGGRSRSARFSAISAATIPRRVAHGFEATRGDHEHTVVKREGEEKRSNFDNLLHPREHGARRSVGLAVDHVWSVDPGAYGVVFPPHPITPNCCLCATPVTTGLAARVHGGYFPERFAPCFALSLPGNL